MHLCAAIPLSVFIQNYRNTTIAAVEPGIHRREAVVSIASGTQQRETIACVTLAIRGRRCVAVPFSVAYLHACRCIAIRYTCGGAVETTKSDRCYNKFRHSFLSRAAFR